MIQPQDKRAAETIPVSLPATYMDRVKAHGKELNDSSPDYVIKAIVMDYFDEGRDRKTGHDTKPKTERLARTKEPKSKAVALPTEQRKAVA